MARPQSGFVLWIQLEAQALPGQENAVFLSGHRIASRWDFLPMASSRRSISTAALPKLFVTLRMGRGGAWGADGTILFDHGREAP